jgi:hypothetical protein
MHAVVLAAAVGAARVPARCTVQRVARIHVVDGMPFVVALRESLRARTRPDGTHAGWHAFVLYDGARPLATIRFEGGGTVVVSGYVARAGNGAVDVQAPPNGCPSKPARVVLSPS